MSHSRKYNILIVEDEFVNAHFTSQTITKLGHNVIGIAVSAEEAFEYARNNKLDLVFMDINIEGSIDGIICARMLNKIDTIPIIYMTAYGDSSTIEEASSTNVYGYLIKPFDEKDIEATLNVAVKILDSLHPSSKQNTSPTFVEFKNNYLYNLKTKTFTIDDVVLSLTNKESQTLHLLCLNINQNVSYDLLQEHVWKEKIVANSTIRDTILRLRKKIPFLHIDNIVGVGYSLKKG